jgi:hypothetical protein
MLLLALSLSSLQTIIPHTSLSPSKKHYFGGCTFPNSYDIYVHVVFLRDTHVHVNKGSKNIIMPKLTMSLGLFGCPTPFSHTQLSLSDFRPHKRNICLMEKGNDTFHIQAITHLVILIESVSLFCPCYHCFLT